MSPMDFARSVATSDVLRDRALGVAIVTRSLTDDTETRAGWPLDETTVRLAANHIGIAHPSDELIRLALKLAPKLSDAMLNKAVS